MEFPEDTLLPFFAYGVFRPGEIAFLRLKPYVEKIEHDCQTNGELLLRDGLAILDPTHANFVKGSLLYFVPKSGGKAYSRIVELEPDKQYKWSEIDVDTGRGVKRANALVGINLPNGCAHSDRPFTSKSDPLFKEAFDLIEEALSRYSNKQSSNEPNPDFINFLHLQMAYMLLWSSIERYVTLRYGLGDDVMKRVLQLATDPFFGDALKSHVNRTDRLFPSNDPSNGKDVKLNKDSPKSSLKYYYQVRCNVTHRGKAASSDFDRLRDSLSELTMIFNKTLTNAFEESANEKS